MFGVFVTNKTVNIIPQAIAVSATNASPAPAGPGTVALRVRLVVAYGPSLPVLAAAVRKQIVADVRRLTGVQVTEVEVSVDDLVVPDT
jgi:hypothetical protein